MANEKEKTKKKSVEIEEPEVNQVNDNKVVEETEEVNQEQEPQDPMAQLQDELNETKDKYVRLSAEFDNYRKRTLREKTDMLKYASEDVMKAILPLVDDFERALKHTEDATEIDAVRKGIELIHSKFIDFLSSKGVKEIEAVGLELDTDLHEAVTKIPAPEKKMKGKIVDVIEKGYKLSDKVIRFSKVVVGE